MLGQAMTPLLGAGLTVATCYAAGSMLLARLGATLRRGEMFALAFVTGAACVHLALFAIFALHVATKPVLFTFQGVVMLAAYLDHRRRAPAPVESFHFSWSENLPAYGYAALFTLFSALYFVNAWAPEASSDGSGYHLTLVVDYLRAHGFHPITTSMYAGLGEGAELLYALAFVLGRHSAAALVHFAFMLTLACLMILFGLRVGKWHVGAGAALLVYFSPVVGKDGSSAYIDLVSAAIVFSIFYWLEIWKETGNDRLLIAVGLLCGYAYAVKYTAVIMLLYTIVMIVWTRRAAFLLPALKICALASVMMLPWMVKDWIYLRDPIAPVGAAIFRNPNLSIHALEDWTTYLRSYHLNSFRQWPLEVTVQGVLLQGPIGPVFLLAPIALLALRDRLGRRLLLAAIFMLIPYPMNIGGRFLISALPFIALAMTLAIGRFPRTVSVLVLAQGVLTWPTIMGTYSAGWRILHFPLQAALRIETEDGFLRRTLDGYDMARLIDDRIPPGELGLAFSGLPTSYMKHNLLIGHESAFGRTLVDTLWSDYDSGFEPLVGLTFKFPEQSLRNLRVLQTGVAPYPNQWSVTELRFLDHGVELPRSPGWRLRAWPNPWEVQLAFDNSAATRWRTGEHPAPGMWIETDFGGLSRVDQVEIQEAPDTMWTVTLQIQTQDESGKWITIAQNPQMHKLPPIPNLRRQATYEIYRRGMHYLVARDDDLGADLFADDPEGWGLQAIGRTRNSTLYKILP